MVAQAVKDKPHMQSLDLNGRRTIEIVDDTQGSWKAGVKSSVCGKMKMEPK